MATRKRTAGKSNKPVPPRRAPTPRGVDREPTSSAKPRRGGARIARKAASEGSVSFEEPISYAASRIRDVKDFPKPGIVFKDITPLVGDPRAFHAVIDALVQRFVGERIDAVVAIESRGFIFGGALAARLNAAFVPVRKVGKLPYKTHKLAYSLEYGVAEIEIHEDALLPGSRVLVIDDLLATGGTAAAAGELVRRQGVNVVAYAFVVELDFLDGRKRLAPTPVVSLIHY